MSTRTLTTLICLVENKINNMFVIKNLLEITNISKSFRVDIDLVDLIRAKQELNFYQ